MPKIPYPAGRNGYFLMSDGENIVWSSPSSSGMALDDLTDVIVGTPNSGEALIYTSGSWRNAAVPAPSSLKDIGDVNASMSPSDGEALMWDGTNTRWDAGTIGNTHNLLAHSDVTSDTPAQAQIIANSATSGFTWKNVKIEIPGAGTTGLTGGGYFSYVSGTTDKMSLNLAVNFAGSGTASTVARSDHSHSLGSLTDVNVGGVSNDQVIVYNDTTTSWEPINYTLSGLSDTNFSTLGDGDLVVWDNANSEWRNITQGSLPDIYITDIEFTTYNWPTANIVRNGSTSFTADFSHGIEGHSGTSIVSPQNGEYLGYNGSAWVNSTPPNDYLTSVDASDISAVVFGRTDSVDIIANFAHAISDHTDISFSTLADGDVMVWDNTNGKWHNITQDSLQDIYITDIEFTTYGWPTANVIRQASTPFTADFSHGIEDHSGTSIVSPSNGQYLGYNGSAWVNSTPPDTNYYLSGVNASDIGAVVFTMTGTSNINADFSHAINSHTDISFTGLSTDDIMKWNGTAWENVPIPVTNTYTGSDPIDVTGTTISLLYDSVAGALQLIGNKLAVKLGTSADTAAYGDHSHSGVYEPAFTKNSAFNKNFAGSGSATTVARSDHDHSGVYEPVFTKNSAFNKDFAGSGTASTVARSDHSHSLGSLTDVSISSPTSVQYLGYNGSAWVNSTPPDTNYYLSGVNASDIGAVVFTMTGTSNINADFSHAINSHTDISFTGLSTDDIMKWNGTAWENVPIPVTNTYTGSDPIDVTGTTISLLYDSVAGALQLIGNKLAVKLGTSADTAAYGDHTHSGVYEPAFTKNSAFNKNFAGSGSATTVARSDHTHSNYVATTGDTMTGSLAVDSSGDVFSVVNSAGYFDLRAEGAASGWARGLRAMNSSTLLMEMGFLGTATPSVSYAFIGKAYNDTSARFYPDGAAQLYYNNSLKIATTSTGATLNGSPIVNEAHRDFDKTWQSLSGTGSVTWNVDNGYNAYMSITGNVTLTISNLEDGDYGVLFVNCASSSYTITFPTGTKQAGGGGNTVSTSAGTSYKDIISFVYRGTTLYLTVGQKFS